MLALANAAEETQTLSRGMIYEARNRVEGGDTTLVGRVIAGKAQRVVKRVVGRVRKDPLKYCALKKSVVEDMAARRRTICELFQRCGRDELKFIVDVGLVGGAALGFAQMGAWLVSFTVREEERNRQPYVPCRGDIQGLHGWLLRWNSKFL